MNNIYIITGASGHLGGVILRLLLDQIDSNDEVRCLSLENDTIANNKKITQIIGDLRKKESLIPLFDNPENKNIYVIHSAGIVSIERKLSSQLYEVNVQGTINLLQLSKEFTIKRFIYISSVHAIPEKKNFELITEVNNFNPDSVSGAYAKTKAMASQYCLDYSKLGLDVILLHPSGILGPYGSTNNYLIQMIDDYIHNRIPACIKGGYDFVDVRDVAKGCLLALNKGHGGECYILSNHYYTIKEIFKMIDSLTHSRKKITLPIWTGKICAPFFYLYSLIKKERPLYTSYMLYTLSSNSNFSHQKATAKLGYTTTPIIDTIKDTILYLNN